MTDDEVDAIVRTSGWYPEDVNGQIGEMSRAICRAGIAAERARLLPVLRELIDAGDGIIETIGREKGDVAYDEASERNHRAWAASRKVLAQEGR